MGLRRMTWMGRRWHWVHCVVNRLAWRFGGKPPHIKQGHWLWRLNDWCADHWIHFDGRG